MNQQQFDPRLARVRDALYDLDAAYRLRNTKGIIYWAGHLARAASELACECLTDVGRGMEGQCYPEAVNDQIRPGDQNEMPVL